RQVSLPLPYYNLRPCRPLTDGFYISSKEKSKVSQYFFGLNKTLLPN
ncbi:Uncharacterized protein BM_BM909, partial [Brugia malayi]|uniref:Bm909 n=1 Tax=Brugia malayi TaxID=6279 RepID=A0A0K0JY30_BRUMA